jgi:hypothetical protein
MVFRLQIAPKFFIESENIIVMSSQEKKKAYEGEDPEPPDPGDKGAKFLGWMRKRGSIRPFALCEDYSRSIGLDLEEFAKEMGREHIIIGGTGNGEIAVKLVNKNWAGKWQMGSKIWLRTPSS